MKHFTVWALLGGVACIAGACASRSDRGGLNPDDFATPSQARAEGASVTSDGREPAHKRLDTALEAARRGEIGLDVPIANPAATTPTDESSQPQRRPAATTDPSADDAPLPDGDAGASAAPAGSPLPLAGMVGQVNGRAIYAADVFDNIGPSLEPLARQLTPSQFRERARELIRATLEAQVVDALILGEAERDLTKRERAILQWSVSQEREELLRKHGQGSISLAEARLKESTGKSLDETLLEFRQRWIVEHHIRNKVLPRINVTRRDVERYYRDHPGEFNPQDQRTLRLIRVPPEDAGEVARRLEAGETFAAVASSELNRNRPESGGLMEAGGTDDVFSQAELNEAMLGLEAGQWAGPIRVGGSAMFIFLESHTPGERRELRDVQLAIERKLREDQYRLLSAAERERLLKDGSYNPVPEMVDRLLDMAMARYAREG